RECALTTRHQLVHDVAVGLAVLLDALWKLVATVCQDAGRLSAEVRPGSDVEQVGLLVLALPHPLRTGQREPGLTPDRTEPEKVEGVDHVQSGIRDQSVRSAGRRAEAQVVRLVERRKPNRAHETGSHGRVPG